jgi:predicted glycoside hydrolase/deacetylase ChbG (UPF0249 family)
VTRLIVNADDLGYSRGVNAGILRAHREGIVTSATLMTNAPATEDAAARARAAPSLGVGVHLVLTYGRPLSDPATVASLVGPDGAFLRPREIVGTGRVRSEHVLAEYRAQYRRARALLGREPTHVDTHHWVQSDPLIGEAFTALAAETGAAARSLDSAQRDRLRAAGVRTPDRFERGFYDQATTAEDLLRILDRLAAEAGVVELMCHPGDADPELERRSSYAGQRQAELASLVDPAARTAARRLGLVLICYADLA